MSDTVFKAFERWVCKIFGGERWWEAPEECKGTDPFAPEAKYRKRIPNWLEDMVLQAERQARDDQLPLVVLGERQRKRIDSLVIIRLIDFIDWYVGWHTEPEAVDSDDT